MSEYWCDNCIENLLDNEPECLTVGVLGARLCVACGKAVKGNSLNVLKEGTLRKCLSEIAEKHADKNVKMSVHFIVIGNRRFICPDPNDPNPIGLSPCEVIPLQGDTWKENYEDPQK